MNLKANTAAFAQAMDRARNVSLTSLKGIERAAKLMAAAFVAAGAAVALALGKMLSSAAKTADELIKLSRTTGITVESLSALGHAADLAGINQETLAKGLSRMARAASDAANGLETAARPFRQLGIDINDANGRLRPMEELLGDLADRFSKMEDGTKKAALAQELLGRSGALMITFLNEGREGFAAAAKEALKFGKIISTDTALAAERLRDNFSRLGGIVSGLGLRLLGELAPALAGATEQMVNLGVAATDGQTGIQKIANFLKELATGLVAVGATAIIAAKGILTLGQVAALNAQFRFTEAAKEIALSWKSMSDTAASAADLIGAIWEGASKKFNSLVFKPPPGIEEAGKKVKDVVVGLSNALDTNFTPALEAARPTLLSLAEQFDRLPLAIRPLGPLLDGMRDKWLAMFEAARRVFEETRTPLERAQKSLAEVNDLLDAGLISLETWNRASEQINKNLGKLTEDTGKFKDANRDLAHVIGTAFEDAILRMKSFRDILSALLQDIARIILRATITKPLEALFGGGFGGGGLLGALGSAIGSLFGGGRQFGGPVLPRRAFLVGERGPELFVPQVAGRIQPSAAGVTQVFQIDARGAEGATESKIRRAAAELEARAASRAVLALAERQLRTA